LEFNADAPIYLQIADAIKRKIVSGAWKGGSKITPVRELALDMGVNPNTAQRAVALLEHEGLVHTERTSGRFVTTDAGAVERARRAMTAGEIEAFLASMRDMGYRDHETQELFTQHIKSGEEKNDGQHPHSERCQ